MTRLGVFGGSFNPPHIGHLRIADAAERSLDLDRVLWIPNAVSPFKTDEEIEAGGHRLAMTRLAAAGRTSWFVSDMELTRGGISYTVDTLRALSEEHPSALLHFLLGADTFLTFETFREPDAIRRLARLVVYPRGRISSPPASLKREDVWLDETLVDVSSTDIRKRLEGEAIADLVPGSVLEYIERYGLYGRSRHEYAPS